MVKPIDACVLPWLWERARLDPDGFALRFESRELTFAELAAGAEAAARRLVSLGPREGDRVATLMDSSVRSVELIHAAQRLGVVLVPLNTRLTVAEIGVLLDASDPVALVYDSSYLNSIDALRRNRFRAVESMAEFDSLPLALIPELKPIERDAPHAIIFTSGTTGTPKGALLTNGNHFASALASRDKLGAMPSDRWLDLLPLYHVAGLSILLRSVIDGSGVVLHRGFDAGAANRSLREDRITLLSVVATMLARMLDDNREGPYPSLRCVLVGGGPVPPELVSRAAQMGVPVAPTYGLTETASQVVTANPKDAILKPGSCGRPLLGNRIKIVDPDESGRGEIAVKGPSVMAGYFRAAAETRAVLREGWLYTGDIGRFDSDNFLYIDDRRGDLVVTGGENVYPAEVEAVLLSHPALAEAAVYSVEDPEWGHRVAAAVVARAGLQVSAQELRAWCSPRLARFKIPTTFSFLDALPRTASGKIKRAILRSSSPRKVSI